MACGRKPQYTGAAKSIQNHGSAFVHAGSQAKQHTYKHALDAMLRLKASPEWWCFRTTDKEMRTQKKGRDFAPPFFFAIYVFVSYFPSLPIACIVRVIITI